jgi:chromate reductase
MSREYSVGVLVGSLRRGSHSARLAEVLAAQAPPSLQLERVAIDALPLYNADLEDDPPPAWKAFRARIVAADALLFVTPAGWSTPLGNCWSASSAPSSAG